MMVSDALAFWPFMKITPFVGGIKPAMERKSVLLPLPERPISATFCPFCRVKEIFFKMGLFSISIDTFSKHTTSHSPYQSDEKGYKEYRPKADSRHKRGVCVGAKRSDLDRDGGKCGRMQKHCQIALS